ncbi:hypothetical protein ACFS5J_05725 [Flavobacterium chuncheonense]|uniref:Uncharacterized protein n=1 Tax=Flavobacterium chuncheonense TaxID=2026653 RepID=A0ABW5YKG4_9FLAO
MRVPIENAKKMIQSIEKNQGSVSYILFGGGHHAGSTNEEDSYINSAMLFYFMGLIDNQK